MSRKQADLVFTLALLTVLLWMVWESSNWGYRARLFPVVVGVAAVGLSVLEVGVLLRSLGAARAVNSADQRPAAAVARRSLQMLAWVLAMAVVIVVLGFELAAGLLSFLFLRFAAHERVRTSVAVGVLMYVSFYVVFDRLLLVPFPPGALSEVLGLDKPLDHYLVDTVSGVIQNR